MANEPLVAVTIFLPPDVGAQVRRASVQANTTSSQLLETLIKTEFQKPERINQAVEEARKASAA